MAIDCDNPSEIAQAAACFCYGDERTSKAVELYLLATIAGGSLDPKVLAQQAAAAGFSGIPPGYADSVMTLLLCNIVNSL
jgi:hypothetical protein